MIEVGSATNARTSLRRIKAVTISLVAVDINFAMSAVQIGTRTHVGLAHQHLHLLRLPHQVLYFLLSLLATHVSGSYQIFLITSLGCVRINHSSHAGDRVHLTASRPLHIRRTLLIHDESYRQGQYVLYCIHVPTVPIHLSRRHSRILLRAVW